MQGAIEIVRENIEYIVESIDSSRSSKLLKDAIEEGKAEFYNPQHLPKNSDGEYDKSLRQTQFNNEPTIGVWEHTKDEVLANIQGIKDSNAVKLVIDSMESVTDNIMNPSDAPKTENNTDSSFGANIVDMANIIKDKAEDLIAGDTNNDPEDKSSAYYDLLEQDQLLDFNQDSSIYITSLKNTVAAENFKSKESSGVNHRKSGPPSENVPENDMLHPFMYVT